jgi:hypothetical protein
MLCNQLHPKHPRTCVVDVLTSKPPGNGATRAVSTDPSTDASGSNCPLTSRETGFGTGEERDATAVRGVLNGADPSGAGERGL